MVRTIIDRFLEHYLDFEMYYNNNAWYALTTQGEIELYENGAGDTIWLYDEFGNYLFSSSNENDIINYINERCYYNAISRFLQSIGNSRKSYYL